jgi:hypothetical protein
MPFSNPFKKSPKKEPEGENPFGSPEMQKKRYDAAMEFLKDFQERMPLVGGKPHAGTVLSVSAQLAGTSLFRSINKKDATPGTIVLSEEVNQAYPHLLNLFAFYCKQYDVDVMSRPLVTEFPEDDKPLMKIEQVLAEYQNQYHEIMKRHGLDHLEGARVGMIVCSIMFQYHAMQVKDIDPFVATGIVAMGVVEGAKTAPPPLGSEVSPSEKTEKKEKNNNRLVLGERDAAIREALELGGAYIDLNPEVIKTLQQGNIDPYIIYEQGLKKQINVGIPRIDFVKADVDALFDEWNGKQLDQAPNHVRLLFWLKDNASAHGYEQRGNSWILKGDEE